MIIQKKNFDKHYERKIFASVSVFYVIAILLRYLTNKTQVLSGIDNTFLKVILQAIGPTIGALVAFKLFRIKSVMTLKGDFKNFLVPLSIYWLLPIVVIETIGFFSKEAVPRTWIISILVYALFEEIGWRGFLEQALLSLPKFARILIITTLWFIWHLNFDMTSSNLTFFFVLLLGSWVLGFLAEKTSSLFCVSAIHSLNNFFSDLNLYTSIILSVLLISWILSVVYRRKIGGQTKKLNTQLSI